MNYKELDIESESDVSQKEKRIEKYKTFNICNILQLNKPIRLKIIIALLFSICIVQTTIIIVSYKINNCNSNNNTKTSESIINNLNIGNRNGNNTNNTNNITEEDNSVLCGTRILKFTSGNFTLNPCDYRFTKYITLEMWGSGGAGSSYNGHGGSSGGYIKLTIPTYLQTFYLSVGKGGIGNYFESQQNGCSYYSNFPYSNYKFGIPNNGTDSIVKTLDNTTQIIARGGKWNNVVLPYFQDRITCFLPVIRPYIENNTITGSNKSKYKIIYNLNGNNETFVLPLSFATYYPGIPGWCINPVSDYYGYNGGSAPFGGAGGSGSINTLNYKTPYQSTNGFYPGGGGGGSGANYDSGIPAYACTTIGGSGKAHGADGLINVYY
jgi:hypothetical protein